MSSRRRSSLVAVYADHGQQEGSISLSGILILLLVLAGIAAVWINDANINCPNGHYIYTTSAEFTVDSDDTETTLYRTGTTRKAGGRKLHQFHCVGATSLKDCECDKVVSDALNYYVEKHTIRDKDSDEDDSELKKATLPPPAKASKPSEPKHVPFDKPVSASTVKKNEKHETKREPPKAKPTAKEKTKATTAFPAAKPSKLAGPAPTPIVAPKIVGKKPVPPKFVESDEDESDSGLEDSAENKHDSKEEEASGEEESDEGVEDSEESQDSHKSGDDSHQESEESNSASDSAEEEDETDETVSGGAKSERASDEKSDSTESSEEMSTESTVEADDSDENDDDGFSHESEKSKRSDDEASSEEDDLDIAIDGKSSTNEEHDSSGGSQESGSDDSREESAAQVDRESEEDSGTNEQSGEESTAASTAEESEEGSENGSESVETLEADQTNSNERSDDGDASEEEDQSEESEEESNERSSEEQDDNDDDDSGVEEAVSGSEDEDQSKESGTLEDESEQSESAQDSEEEDSEASTGESSEASQEDEDEGDSKEDESAEEHDESEESLEEDGSTEEDSGVEDGSQEASEEGLGGDDSGQTTEEDETDEEESEEEIEPVVVEKPKKTARKRRASNAPIPKVVLDGVRHRSHIARILGFEQIGTKDDIEEEELMQQILKDIKKTATDSIKPLEKSFKFSDISQRVLGDAEIFNKPMVLFLGPWSSGKSTAINYLLGTHSTKAALKTGPQPTDSFFTVLHHNEDGTARESGLQMASDWAFSGVNRFGQAFLSHFRGIGLKHPLLEKVTIVDTPGIIDGRNFKDFSLQDVFQWFIDRADAIYVIFDPSKLEIGHDMKALLDQLRGREQQTRFLLNKGDLVAASEVMRVTGQLLWNVAPLFDSSDAPIIYTVSMISRPYLPGSPMEYFQDQEEEFLRHLKEVMDERIENTIMYARRHAVRVRNHAKLVDCYLEAYYRHKGMFGNKKKVAEQIINEPAKYQIFDTISQSKNISKYDLLEPEDYSKFFKLNPLPEFSRLMDLCGYVKGCPIDKLNRVIAYDLPHLLTKYLEKSMISHNSEEDGDRPGAQVKVPMKSRSKGKSKSR